MEKLQLAEEARAGREHLRGLNVAASKIPIEAFHFERASYALFHACM